jgi:hypothetical protein
MEIRHVKFFNNQIAVSYWDKDKEIWKEESISKLKINFLSLLRTNVFFDSKLTINGFMNQLETYSDIIDSTFEASSRGYKLEFYLKNMRENDLTDECLDLSSVEFYRAVEIWDDDISEYCSFHAKSKNDKLNYSLTFSPIKNWKHLPFKLNTEYAIYNYDKKESVNIPMISSNKYYTLYEILDSFIFELTYHGSPEEQAERNDELLDTCSKIEKGEMKMYSLDEIYLDHLEEELDELIHKEDYEEAKKIKKEIEELKIKIKKDGN